MSIKKLSKLDTHTERVANEANYSQPAKGTAESYCPLFAYLSVILHEDLEKVGNDMVSRERSMLADSRKIAVLFK